MNSTILVVGDLFLQRRKVTTASVLQGGSLVPLATASDTTFDPGGSGAVAFLLWSLGHSVLLAGVKADDEPGRVLTGLLDHRGITTCLLNAIPTTNVEDVVECNGAVVSRSRNSVSALNNADTSAMITSLYQIPPETLSTISCVVVADHDFGGITDELIETIKQLVAAYSVPVVLATTLQRRLWRDWVSLIVTNTVGAQTLMLNDPHPAMSLAEDEWGRDDVACSMVRRKYRIPSVVVSDAGAIFYTDPALENITDSVEADVCKRQRFDPLSMVTALFATDKFGPVDVALRARNAAAYLELSDQHRVASSNDIDEHNYVTTGWAAKLHSKHTARLFVDRKREMLPGCRVVLVSGLFDGLTHLDIEALRFASRQGSVVVVVMDSDEALCRGGYSATVPESFRLTHVAVLPWVNSVFSTGEDICEIVRHFKPEVYVPVGCTIDSAGREIDYVASRGGRVEFVPMRPYTA